MQAREQVRFREALALHFMQHAPGPGAVVTLAWLTPAPGWSTSRRAETSSAAFRPRFGHSHGEALQGALWPSADLLAVFSLTAPKS